jgi:flagellar basal-body rod modification protein FlgD
MMAIDAYGNYAETYTDYSTPATTTTAEDKTSLSKDDFLKLLLVELEYQDPTEPMDSEKILSQTSQLATLEASENTNKALEDLVAALAVNRDFSTVSAIGKLADTGSNALQLQDGEKSKFELYFANNIDHGTISIMDADGNTLKSLNIESGEAGVKQFEWDGTDTAGNQLDAGLYYVTAKYTDAESVEHDTRMGIYPIESVRFEDGKTLVKLGSTYWPFDSIVEVSEG